jgi:hypothetical protein
VSSEPARILYCHCAFAKVVPNEVKTAVLAGLSAAGVEFDAVPDLCEMAARRDPRLQQWSESEPLQIAACYPRAVKWLFSSGGGTLPEPGTRVWNMRVETADTVLDGLLHPRSGEP